MLTRTHLTITLFFILLFISSVEYKLEFVMIAFLSAIIPDIDSRFSKIGKRKVSRILQFFIKHRGVIHSFTFAFLITFVLVLYLPAVAFPFFLGYSLHLFADSFTLAGIRPFYPFKRISFGKIRVGGKAEFLIFLFFVAASLLLFFVKILGFKIYL